MKIALACDHGGFILKAAVARYLAGRGLAVEDFGTATAEAVDYPDFAASACRAVLAGSCDRAVLICGTGLGMAMAASKFPGIRATVCWSPATAEMARKHNDSNCLTLGGRVLDEAAALEIVRIWLDTPFEGGRHQRRLDKIAAIEKTACGR